MFAHLTRAAKAMDSIYQTERDKQLRPITHSCQSGDCGCSPQG